MAIDLNKDYKPREVGTVITENPYSNVKPLITTPDQRSQYDEGFILPTQGADPYSSLLEYRANNQPAVDQLTNSAFKGALIAGTTFADTYAGSAAGLINVFVTGLDMATNSKDDKDAGQRLLNAFINNPVSRGLNDLNEIVNSDYLVNYRTKREMDNEWYENAISATGAANFWGENVLKNAGFMVGAAGASKFIGAGLSRMARIEEARREYKTIQDATKAVLSGIDVDPSDIKLLMSTVKNNPGIYGLEAEKVIKNLADAAKTVRIRTAAVQAATATLGSFGEARIEAIGNGDQFKTDLLNKLDMEFKNPDGTFKVGKDEAQYEQALNKIDNEVMSYQNISFLANAAALSASNYAGWRETYLKSYDFNKKNMIGGSIGDIKGGYKYTSPAAWKATLQKRGLDMLRESQEEQIQFVIDKGTAEYVNSLYNGGDVAGSLLKGLSKGFSEAYGTAEGWENAFAGGLFGFVGVPGINSIFSEYKETGARIKEESSLVDKLNAAIKDGGLDNSKENILTRAYARDLGLTIDQTGALKNEDRKLFEDLKDKKFFNVANAFIEAGKYEDFIDLIESESDLDVEELKKKYSILTKPGDENSRTSLFMNWTETEIRGYIAKQAGKAKDEIKKLRELKDNLDTLYKNQSVTIRNKEGEEVAYMLKDMLTESFYMAERRDKRIQDVRQELIKTMTNPALPMTKEAFDFSMIDNLYNALSGNLLVVNPTPSDILEGKMDLDKVITSLNDYVKRFKASTSDSKVTGLMQDYIDLLSERAMSNLTLAQVSKNDFSDLIASIKKHKAKADKSVSEKQKDEVNKELSDAEKLNIVKEKGKAAGYSNVDGEGRPGNYFTLRDAAGNVRKYEIEPLNVGQEKKKLQDEKEAKLAELNENDEELIKQIEEEYEAKELELLNSSKQEAAIKDFETGEYLRDKKGKLIKFDNAFAIQNFDNLEFISREQGLNIKRTRVAQLANRRKLDAIRELTLELNSKIEAEIVKLGSLIANKKKTRAEIAEYKELKELLPSIKDKGEANKIIKQLEAQLSELEEGIDTINLLIDQLESHKQALVTLAEDIKTSFEEGTNLSFEKYINNLDDLQLSALEKIWARNLSRDLEELLNDNEIQSSLNSLQQLKNNTLNEIQATQEIINNLKELVDKSNTFKEWILASKVKGLPSWFVTKWSVGKNTDPFKFSSKVGDLQDIKRLYQFQKVMNKYAEKYGLSSKETYNEFLNDLKNLKDAEGILNENLNRTYDEIKNLENEILVNSKDLENLKNRLEDIIELKEFLQNELKLKNLKESINQLKIKYTNIINRDSKYNTVEPNQVAFEDGQPSEDYSEADYKALSLPSNAMSLTPFYTTNKTVEQNADGSTKYKDNGFPQLNQNEDAIRWNRFLERTPNLGAKDSNYRIQAFVRNLLPEDSKLRIDAEKRILQGGGTLSDNDIITAVVNLSGEIMTADKDGVFSREGGYIYSFLPLTHHLLGVNSKVADKGLWMYWKKYAGVKMQHTVTLTKIEQDSTHDDDLVEFGKGNQIPLGVAKREIKDFAAKQHAQFITNIKGAIKEGKKVILPVQAVSNGILLKKKAVEGEPTMDSVSNVLLNMRDLDTFSKEGLSNVEVHVVVKTGDNYSIPKTSIIIPNAKKGAVVIYNKVTKEYFYANQRNIDDKEVDLVLHLLELVANNPEKNLNLNLNIGNNKTNFYKDGSLTRQEVPIFQKFGGLSIMNNLIFWGSPNKGNHNKHTIFVDKGKIHYPNPNNNFAMESIPLTKVRDVRVNGNLQAYLKTKRHNVNHKMFETQAWYMHPVIKKGKLEWEMVEGGYKAFLLNGSKSTSPVLVSNAVNSNTKNNNLKLLFASKNIILDINSETGLPKIENQITKEAPKEAPKTESKAAPAAEAAATEAPPASTKPMTEEEALADLATSNEDFYADLYEEGHGRVEDLIKFINQSGATSNNSESPFDPPVETNQASIITDTVVEETKETCNTGGDTSTNKVGINKNQDIPKNNSED